MTGTKLDMATAAGTKIDAGAIVMGAASMVWNFIVSGQLNTILAAVAGAITIVILIQRWRINRRELAEKEKKDVL